MKADITHMKSKIKNSEQTENLKNYCYEINFAEFPIFPLSNRNKKMKFEYRDRIYSKKQKKHIDRVWITEYKGNKPPQNTTFKTFFYLLQIWKQSNFENNRIEYKSILNLLNHLNLNDAGKNFKRIKDDLEILYNISIHTENCIYDANSQELIKDCDFHLFDSKISTSKSGGFILVSNFFSSLMQNYKNRLNIPIDPTYLNALKPIELQSLLYIGKYFSFYPIITKDVDLFADAINLQTNDKYRRKQQINTALNKLKAYKIIDIQKGKITKDNNVSIHKKGYEQVTLFDVHTSRKEDYKIEGLFADVITVVEDYKYHVEDIKKVCTENSDSLIYQAISLTREHINNLRYRKSRIGSYYAIFKDKINHLKGIIYEKDPEEDLKITPKEDIKKTSPIKKVESENQKTNKIESIEDILKSIIQ